MTTEEYRKKRPLANFFGIFLRGTKGIFAADILCATAIAAIDLAFSHGDAAGAYDMLPNKLYVTFFTVIAVMIACYILRSVLNYIVCYYGHTFGIRVEADIREDLFTHIEQMSFDYFDANRTGTMMSRLTTDLFDLTELAHHGPEDLLTSAITVVGGAYGDGDHTVAARAACRDNDTHTACRNVFSAQENGQGIGGGKKRPGI